MPYQLGYSPMEILRLLTLVWHYINTEKTAEHFLIPELRVTNRRITGDVLYSAGWDEKMCS
jgi:hypothetical protein